MSLAGAATIVICARNAAATIARAVRSVAAADCRLLLVDDFSTDDTVACARAVAPLEVVRPPAPGAMGQTRQFGLDRVTTPYLVWLDADDAFLPGRVERLVDALERGGGDIVADGVEIVDGVTDEWRGIAEIPAFVRTAPIRLFERMYLPGPGVIGVRTSVARRIGYDVGLHGCEDVDFLLRALAHGVPVSCLESTGYRLYAYPQSLSRDRQRQREMYARALAKHAFEDIAALFRAAGVDAVTAAWAVVSVAMFRADHAGALRAIEHAERVGAGRAHDVLEPDGPCPYPEAWRVAFCRGTATLQSGDASAAVRDLERACEIVPNAEALNNLGVAYARLGDRDRAADLFAQALAQRPPYADARENAACDVPASITTHPLRVETSRQDYGARPAPTTSCTPREAAR